ncbi:GntR family transcriptional regulator [Alkalithermobacter paradoxus]|uniref:Putative HTH-type transcriptional regulator YydK n=1 Tax=Alkalithermobacter paradoxus TaxID=29349 RepID=A0A1V4I6R0_9FIRM|nr:putative HTH-type transcriptional regulator YydK [[Clostridium] thermoalcaliphilum]
MAAKYRVIVDTLEKELIEGVYIETKKIPTEEELMSRFGVSRNTIRKAIEVLVSRGYLYQVQGSGIFVREAAFKGYVNLERLKGLTTDFPTNKIETKIIDFKLTHADKDLAQKMRCEEGSSVYFVNRLRMVDGKPFGVEYSYFNKAIVTYLNEEIIQKSIYDYIRYDLNLTIGFADRIIYADIISDKDAKILGLPKNSPALINDNIVFLNNGEVFDVSRTIHHYRNVKLLKLSNFRE